MDTRGSSPHARGTLRVVEPAAVRGRIIPACAGNARRRSSTCSTATDHPRMRGERVDIPSVDRRDTGSSPHARGTPIHAVASAPARRIIPACAGNALFSAIPRRVFADHPRMRGERTSRSTATYGESGSSPHARGTRPARQRRGAGRQDHPRMRGERSAPRSVSACSGGSSPHARGTQLAPTGETPRRRIIPACAGNARPRSATRTRAADHPRMRGERDIVAVVQRVAVGSSPHARGTRLFGGGAGQRGRIIPACAGNAREHAGRRVRHADHPRMRGERVGFLFGEDADDGSSPHARGTPHHPPPLPARRRIIPACAGNAPARSTPSNATPDHPRMRGERVRARYVIVPVTGSSPHARGTRGPRLILRVHYRIIPACAGNAGRRAAGTATTPDHPRMRGEREQPPPAFARPDGSSPHARGTLCFSHRSPPSRRIIPACAGNADSSAARATQIADHPRMRGERELGQTKVYVTGGSSPHARGTHDDVGLVVREVRIIPACAGNAPADPRRQSV